MDFDKLQHLSLLAEEPDEYHQLQEQFAHQQLPDLAYLSGSKNQSFQKVKSWIEELPILNPYNPWVLSWLFLVLLVLIYLICQLPIIVFFGSFFYTVYRQQPAILPIYVVCIAIVFVNTLVFSSLAFFKEGVLVLDRVRIQKRFMTHHLPCDLIAITIMVMSVISQNYYLTFTKVLLLVKIPQLLEIDEAFQRVLQFARIGKILYFGLRMLVLMLIFCNYVGGMFYGIDLYIIDQNVYGNQTETYSWLYNNEAWPDLPTRTYSVQYLYTMYWAFNMVTQIAIGDIVPVNAYETLFFFFMMIVSTIIYTYLINLVVEIVIWGRRRVKVFFQQLININEYMARRNIPNHLQTRVRAFVEYLWYLDRGRNPTLQNEIIGQLPHLFQQSLLSQTYQQFFLNFKAMGFPQQFIDELSQSIEEKYYTSQQHVYWQGKCDDCALYYLANGQLEIWYEPGNGQAAVLEKLMVAQNFGWLEFLGGGERCYSAVAKGECHVYKLTKQAYLKEAKCDPTYLLPSLLLRDHTTLSAYRAQTAIQQNT